MYQNYKTEQYNLKCSVKKSILHCLQMLSELKPIQVADDNISQEDFYEGQKEFYEFVEKLYCLMLSDPDKFLIPTNEYDTYIQSDKAEVFNFKKQRTLITEN
jgi:enolase